MILVTTDTVPGHAVRHVLGAVAATANGKGYSREPGYPESNIGVDLARDRAFRQLHDVAARRGANAVVGVRLDAEYASGQSVVTVYGTAVVVDPSA
jgi:uncharacterized protein YbjQ (UPF0145 family)